jgi:hypothetical protein
MAAICRYMRLTACSGRIVTDDPALVIAADGVVVVDVRCPRLPGA